MTKKQTYSCIAYSTELSGVFPPENKGMCHLNQVQKAMHCISGVFSSTSQAGQHPIMGRMRCSIDLSVASVIITTWHLHCLPESTHTFGPGWWLEVHFRPDAISRREPWTSLQTQSHITTIITQSLRTLSACQVKMRGDWKIDHAARGRWLTGDRLWRDLNIAVDAKIWAHLCHPSGTNPLTKKTKETDQQCYK